MPAVGAVFGTRGHGIGGVGAAELGPQILEQARVAEQVAADDAVTADHDAADGTWPGEGG